MVVIITMILIVKRGILVAAVIITQIGCWYSRHLATEPTTINIETTEGKSIANAKVVTMGDIYYSDEKGKVNLKGYSDGNFRFIFYEEWRDYPILACAKDREVLYFENESELRSVVEAKKIVVFSEKHWYRKCKSDCIKRGYVGPPNNHKTNDCNKEGASEEECYRYTRQLVQDYCESKVSHCWQEIRKNNEHCK